MLIHVWQAIGSIGFETHCIVLPHLPPLIPANKLQIDYVETQKSVHAKKGKNHKLFQSAVSHASCLGLGE